MVVGNTKIYENKKYIMNLYNKKYLYVNGSSVSAGGGFEPKTFRTDIRDSYREMGVSLPGTQTECSYPYMISQQLGLTLINESKSGSGVDRLIRKTLQFIFENADKINDTIFILELQMGLRLDWYVEEWGKYGVLNASYNPFEFNRNNTNYPFTLVQEWHVDDVEEQNKWNQKYNNDIKGYLNNFFNHDIHFKRESDKILMFISFLNQLKLDYLISIPEHLSDNYKNILSNILPDKNNLNKLFMGMELWKFSEKFKLLIRDEVSHSDNHLGYAGNKKISKILTSYINNINEYKLKIFKIYSKNDFKFFKNFFINHDVLFQQVFDTKDSNCIVLNNIDTNFNETDFSIVSKIKDDIDIGLVNKKFLICYHHEKMNQNVFENKINTLKSILKIDESQIILIDSSVNKKDNVNIEVPLEFKLKQYNEYYSDFFIKNKENILYKNKIKKFTFLAGKSNINRAFVFDKIVYHFGDIEKLKSENIIAMNFSYSTNSFFNKNDFKLKGNELINLELPWEVDDHIDIYSLEKQNISIHKHYQNSIFSIICETHSEYEPYDFSLDYLINQDIRFTNFQISEKSILPILNGNLPFIVHDGLIYQKLEDIGFDFSYLKNIFGINYKTNSFKQNADSIELFINYIKSKSIEELNEIRKDNNKFIENNFEVLINIFDGYLSQNENEFLKWLFDETYTIH